MAIGERLPVADAATRVRGTVHYTLNVEVGGALVGAIARSTQPHARIVRVDASRAEQVPGVLAVLTRDDVLADPRLSPRFGALERDQPVIALDRVRYVGEPMAAVAAIDADAAAEAAALIEVEYEPLPAILTLTDLDRPDTPEIHDGTQNRAGVYVVDRGDVAYGLSQADVVVEGTYTTPVINHVALEPHVVVAQVERDGRVVVQSNTQTPHHLRRQISEILGVPLAQVRVIVHMLGGGFGGKCYPKIEPLTILLARKARRPVKIVLSRSEVFVSAARQATRTHIRAGLTREGRLVAVEATSAFENGAYMETAERVVRNGARALAAPYDVPNVHVEGIAYYTNTVPCGPFRAPGAAQTAWAMESHMDVIARRLGIDPLQLRLRNFVRSGQSYVDGGLLEDIRYPEMLQAAADAVGWGESADVPGLAPTERLGRGLSAVMKTTNTPSTSTASVKLNEDGSLDVLTSSVEMGQGATTVLAQIAAERSGVDVRKVRVSEPDTDTTPYDQSTSSSRTTFAMGEAINRAVDDVREQVRGLAADHFEASPDDIELSDGHAAVRGAPDRSVEYGALIRLSRTGNIMGEGVNVTSAKPDPVSGKTGASAHYHQSVGAAEVAVDVESGRVRVLRLHAGVFAGRMVNHTLCELQTDGSSCFGLGQALFEEVHFDGGQVANANLGDYLIPGLRDLPQTLDSHLYEEPGHGEVHGIGEVATPLAPPAIANAVADALGIRIPDLPLTPERILRALRDQPRR